MRLARVCESPIEIMLARRIAALLQQTSARELELVVQYRLGRFRYDIGLRRKGTRKPLLLIECDGRRFHQTPAQLANDRAKDQAAKAAGIKLLRWTGSEVYRFTESIAVIALRACGVRVP